LRYRFANFVVSPRRRLVLRDGVEQPLIPRYFDLLVFLIERRHEAVHRRDIFDHVWTDVIVSDSALSQAVRTLRRTLADDSREPRFIRTVSRHGYRFVFVDVVEEADDEGPAKSGIVPADAGTHIGPAKAGPHVVPAEAGAHADARTDAEAGTHTDIEALLARITRPATESEDEDQREAAEILHTIGTADALRQLGVQPGHERARALLRDTRWEAPAAGPVPIIGQPAALATAAWLVRLRLRRAARIAAARWASAAIGAGLAAGRD
jgi:DNA-binding winged helix-turn-helix (wHTH) protein